MTWRDDYRIQIDQHAGLNKLNPALVAAVIEVESGGNQWAMRYEQHYRYLAVWNTGAPYKGHPLDFPKPPGVSRNTELIGQKTSYGLMQIMGAVARERGFRGAFLTELCDPKVGLNYGCRHLALCIREKGGDIEKGLLRWNGGAAPDYPTKVLSKVSGG